MISRLILASALLLPAAARAAGCTSMNAASFEKYVDDAMGAIDDDDLVRMVAVIIETTRRWAALGV